MRFFICALFLLSSSIVSAKNYSELTIPEAMVIIQSHYERLRTEMADLKKKKQNIESVDTMLEISEVLVVRKWPGAENFPSPKRERMTASYRRDISDMITHLKAMKIAFEKNDTPVVKEHFESLDPCVYRERHLKKQSQSSSLN